MIHAEKFRDRGIEIKEQWIFRSRFASELFSEQLLLLRNGFGGCMINGNDPLGVNF